MNIICSGIDDANIEQRADICKQIVDLDAADSKKATTVTEHKIVELSAKYGVTFDEEIIRNELRTIFWLQIKNNSNGFASAIQYISKIIAENTFTNGILQDIEMEYADAICENYAKVDTQGKQKLFNILKATGLLAEVFHQAIRKWKILEGEFENLEKEKAREIKWKCLCGTENNGQFCRECGRRQINGYPIWRCECGTLNDRDVCYSCSCRRHLKTDCGFSFEELLDAVSALYNDAAKKDENEVEIVKFRMRDILYKYGIPLVFCEKYNALEIDCLQRIIKDQMTFNVDSCNKLIEKLRKYDALEVNIEDAVRIVKSRISSLENDNKTQQHEKRKLPSWLENIIGTIITIIILVFILGQCGS